MRLTDVHSPGLASAVWARRRAVPEAHWFPREQPGAPDFICNDFGWF